MRSTLRWLQRPVAAVLSFWFVLVMVEPAALHACPVHGDHEAASIATEVVSDAAHAEHGTPAPSSHDHAGCTCPGDCAASSVGSAAPSALVAPGETSVGQGTAGVDGALLRSQPRAPFVLPFANGPPARSQPA